MLLKGIAFVGSLKVPLNEGDFTDTADQDEIVEDQTAGGTTLLGVEVAARNVRASGNAGAVATTLPSAQQILEALRGGMGTDVPPANSPYGPNIAPEKEFPSNMGIIPQRASFRFTLINANAGTNTLTAPATAGILISGTATALTNTWREWIVRILSSAPLAVIPVTTTNTTLTLTNIPAESISKIQPGMSVYGTGIGALAIVTAVNRDTRVVTVSVASTATADNVAVTFTPTVQFKNLRAGAI